MENSEVDVAGIKAKKRVRIVWMRVERRNLATLRGTEVALNQFLVLTMIN